MHMTNKRQRLDDYELGYTPDNLRLFTHRNQMTREEVSELLGVSLDTVHVWCAAPSAKKHRTMPAQQWRHLRGLVGG